MRLVAILSSVVLGACTQTGGEANDELDSPSEAGSATTAMDSETDSETDSDTGSESDPWELVFQANQDIGAIMSVWGSSPDVLFVVGGQPTPGGGAILRGHDQLWEPEPLPLEVPMLNWVYGVDGEVWSVGTSGTILRRDLGTWVAEPSPTDRVLWGLWGASSDELWAVGGDGVTDAPVLLRRDAAGLWTSVELPPLGVNAHALFKVWGSAGDDVWIVGDVGATLHYDGVEWTANPDPDGIDLISVWGSDTEGVIAVGGRASGRIDRPIDGAWSGQTHSIPGLNGVWVDPEGTATAVGGQGTIYRITPGGFELEPEASGTSMVLHSVWGFPGGPRYAVGGSLLMPAPWVGVILRAQEG